MNKFITLIILLFSCLKGVTQTDSATLGPDQFLHLVSTYHPMVRLSTIKIERSYAEVQIARGAFNPILSNNLSNKTFDQTNYYYYVNPNITIPAWFGIDLSTGVEYLSGNRFDPTETVGQSSYIGLNVPLIKNLLIDKRRAYLKQAQLFTEMAVTEQQIVINDILQEAISQYWEWANTYLSYEIVLKTYYNSKQRFELVKSAFLHGERPALDTTESLIQMQNLEAQKNESWMQFQNRGIELSAFLWKEDNTPYLLPSFVIPGNEWKNENYAQMFNLQFDDLINFAQAFHPEIKSYVQKGKILEIDRKLKFQENLPKLDFKFNHLAKGYNMFDTKGLLFENNFQYGLKFEMPLLLSQGKGEYKKTKLKIEENNIARTQKLQSIELKLKKYINEYNNIKYQMEMQKNILANYQIMLKAEELLFSNGESSLFLINSRENKVIESERKLIDLKTKYFKVIYAIQWSAGMLNRDRSFELK